MITDFKNSSIVNNCKSKSLQQETIYEMKKGSKLPKKNAKLLGGQKIFIRNFFGEHKSLWGTSRRGFCGKASPPHKILQSFRLFFVSASSSTFSSIFPLMFFILTNRSWRKEKNPFYHHKLKNILGNPRDFLSKKALFRRTCLFLAALALPIGCPLKYVFGCALDLC